MAYRPPWVRGSDRSRDFLLVARVRVETRTTLGWQRFSLFAPDALCRQTLVGSEIQTTKIRDYPKHTQMASEPAHLADRDLLNRHDRRCGSLRASSGCENHVSAPRSDSERDRGCGDRTSLACDLPSTTRLRK